MTPEDAQNRPFRDEAPLRNRHLSVSADLRIDIDGAPDAVRVTGDGERVTVAIADASTAARIGLDGRRLGGARETLAALTGGLSEVGVDVDVTVGGRQVVTVGPSARPGPVARAVGLDGVQVAAPPKRVQLALGAALVALGAGLYFALRDRS